MAQYCTSAMFNIDAMASYVYHDHTSPDKMIPYTDVRASIHRVAMWASAIRFHAGSRLTAIA